MARGVHFYQTGGPDVLQYEHVTVGEPGPGEVRLRHVAVGLNFADTYFRTGMYPAPLPSGIGVEASGVIEEVGDGVNDFAPGDRVTYTGSPLGAYSTERVMPAQHLLTLDPQVDFDVAAGSTMRGLTTAYLLRRVYPLQPGDTVLLHAAAGGVGLLFCQWAHLLGIRVIGSVSTESKAAAALAHGCDEVIIHTRENLVDRVRALTGGRGVPVVYDSVGATTFHASLDCLARRGLLVCFGAASGPIPPIDAMQLATRGSLFITRPALADYISDPVERAELAGEFFGHVAAGRIVVDINQRYRLDEAGHAHRELESGRSIGSSILIP